MSSKNTVGIFSFFNADDELLQKIEGKNKGERTREADDDDDEFPAESSSQTCFRGPSLGGRGMAEGQMVFSSPFWEEKKMLQFGGDSN